MKEIIVVCNNISPKKASSLKSSWGLSFLIRKDNGTILFDTGPSGRELPHNLKKLDINTAEIKKIVISHNHPDHTGGINLIANKNGSCKELYLPCPLDKIPEVIRKSYKKVVRVKGKIKLQEGIYTSGLLGFRIREQALCIDSGNGLIALIGCAHPGIVKMVSALKTVFGKEIHTVLGGFHLEMHPPFVTKIFIKQLKEMGVTKIGPTHCIDNSAVRLLRDAYKSNFIEMNLGDRYCFN